MNILFNDTALIIIILSLGAFITFLYIHILRINKNTEYIEKLNLKGLHRRKKLADDGPQKKIQIAEKKKNLWIDSLFKGEFDFGFSSPEMRELFEKAGWKNADTGTVYLKFLILVMIFSSIIFYFIFDFLPLPLSLQSLLYKCCFALLGFIVPAAFFKLFLNFIGHKRSARMEPMFYDILDLLIIILRSGMSLEKSLNEINTFISIPDKDLKEELNRLELEMTFIDFETALRNFQKRFPSPLVKEFVAIAIQSRQQGSPLAENLTHTIKQWQRTYVVHMEKVAQNIPVRITFITAIFFLPTLFIFILAPLLIKYI